MNEASATNSLMNISDTLYVITDAKVFCSILYSSGNIQINPPSPSVTLSLQKPQYPEGER